MINANYQAYRGNIGNHTNSANEFSSFLGAKDYLADQGLMIKNGQLIVPEGPGIGLSLDPKKLRKYRLDI
ncbi:MAG: hypothetical protein HYY77_22710 [Betaproteobacteria bacterium]|nr:hypothetical protein [Betaproteobacteria bacterium]